MSIISDIKDKIRYYLPQKLYVGSSAYNEKIEVIKVGSTTKLVVKGIVQSLNKGSGFAKHKVWGHMHKIICDNKSDLSNILILGMGGGTIIHMIHESYPSTKIFAAEIDGLIISLGKKYFDLSSIPNLTIIEGDAGDVVTNPSKYNIPDFDCIVVDTYCGGLYPSKGNELSYLQKIEQLLLPKGLLVVNRIVYKNDTVWVTGFSELLSSVVKDVKTDKVIYPTIADNYIFYGFKK